MKTLEEVIASEPMFLNDWSDIDGVAYDFADQSIKDLHVLLASYTYQDYSGDAFVLFEKEGKLYCAYGSHCSCYGLEGQFEPEETPLEQLQYSLKEGKFGYRGYYNAELKALLGID